MSRPPFQREHHRLILRCFLTAHHALVNSAEYIEVRGVHGPRTSSCSSSIYLPLQHPFHLAGLHAGCGARARPD